MTEGVSSDLTLVSFHILAFCVRKLDSILKNVRKIEICLPFTWFAPLRFHRFWGNNNRPFFPNPFFRCWPQGSKSIPALAKRERDRPDLPTSLPLGKKYCSCGKIGFVPVSAVFWCQNKLFLETKDAESFFFAPVSPFLARFQSRITSFFFYFFATFLLETTDFFKGKRKGEGMHFNSGKSGEEKGKSRTLAMFQQNGKEGTE